MKLEDFVYVAANNQFWDTVGMVPLRRSSINRMFGKGAAELIARIEHGRLVESCGVASGQPLILKDVIFTKGVMRPAPGCRALNTWRRAA